MLTSTAEEKEEQGTFEKLQYLQKLIKEESSTRELCNTFLLIIL